jgi:glycosyltransferase involved in cell wall biosynthesis
MDSKKRIKVMIVTPYFYPKIGGLENYALNIAKQLLNNYNYEVFIVTSNHEDKKYRKDLINKMRIYRLPRQIKVSNTPISFKWKKQIEKIIKDESPDIINAHSPVPFISDVAAKIAQKKKIPFLFSYHTANLYKKNNLIANSMIYGYKITMENRTFKFATKVLPVSDYVKSCFDKYIQKKALVLTNAIPKKSIIKKASKNKKYDLLFINNLGKTHSWKGLEEIIYAIKIYVNKFDSTIKMVVVGEGDKRNYYETLTKRLNLTKNIYFVGAKHGNNKKRMFNLSKMLIIYPTTSNDAFPTVILEGWASGLPVIASDIGAIPTIIENNVSGVLARPNDSKDLADKINKLLINKKLQQRLSKKGIREAKKFTWEKVAGKFDKIIKKIIKNEIKS